MRAGNRPLTNTSGVGVELTLQRRPGLTRRVLDGLLAPFRDIDERARYHKNARRAARKRVAQPQ
jgi:hypothetical protein